MIMNWPEGKDFRILLEKEVVHAEDASIYGIKYQKMRSNMPCCIVGNNPTVIESYMASH